MGVRLKVDNASEEVKVAGKAPAKKGEVKEAVAPVEAEVKEEEAKNLGLGQKDIAFVAPLGDPSNPDTTRIKGKDGSDLGTKVTPTIVGYRFKALKDLKVPDCGTDVGLKKDLMNYVDLNRPWKAVKAGEEFDLTIFETAYLISQEDYIGSFKGGERPVRAVYQFQGRKSKAGTVTMSSSQKTPRVSLRSLGQGSIKDQTIIEVLSFTEEKQSGRKRKIRVINPGFEEKFGPLTVAAVPRTSGSGSTHRDNSEVDAANAKRFLSFVHSKKTQSK